VFDVRRGPCYRCLYPEQPPPGLVPNCAEGGVLGVLPGVIGMLQAVETVKLLLGIGEPLIGRLLVFDALAMTFRQLTLRKDPACPLCGEHPTIKELQDYDELCGLTSPDAEPAAGMELTTHEAAELMARPGGFTLLDVREPHEHRIARIPGAVLIPLGSLPARLAELDSSRPMVVYCHHGLRSLHAVELLRGAGFARAISLRGGIDAWSTEVDPGVPRY